MNRRAAILGAGGALLACGLPARSAQTVSVLYADSLVTLFEKTLVPALQARGYTLNAEGRGSVANANMIREGLKRPDVFIASDARVMESLLTAANPTVRWYASFATTRLALAYSASSPFAARFRDVAAGRATWYDVLQMPGLKIGRPDPAVDPLGYRAIIALELAKRLYHQPLRRRILGDDRNPAQIFPGETLLVRLEQNEVDVAFVYALEATARRLPSLEFPATINLGDPNRAAEYAAASVTINGVTHVGAPIAFAFTIPSDAVNPEGAVAVLRFITSGDGRAMAEAGGLTMRPLGFHGDLHAVPAGLAP